MGARRKCASRKGMLRDLRITTAKVESRRGDEQVDLLGELAVDEAAYAEVGVPVASRVIRLLAGLGDAVRRDQALLELQSDGGRPGSRGLPHRRGAAGARRERVDAQTRPRRRTHCPAAGGPGSRGRSGGGAALPFGPRRRRCTRWASAFRRTARRTRRVRPSTPCGHRSPERSSNGGRCKARCSSPAPRRFVSPTCRRSG